jgi:ketosteroid isomerase-like protein
MKHRSSAIMSIIVSATAALLVGCTSTKLPASGGEVRAARTTFDLAAARNAVLTWHAEFARLLRRRDTEGLARLYAYDAKLISATGTVAGRAQIQEVLERIVKSDVAGIEVTVTDVWGNEELLAEEGTATFIDGKGIELGRSTYLELWKREEGTWKVFRNSFGYNPVAAVSVPIH